MNNTGILYIVGTPIGNLEDITLRALRTLKEVDLIACEDTRVTKKLLDHFEIKTQTISYFQHSKLSKIEYLIDQLKLGKNIALVSDAGTPGISDPGQYLIAQIQNQNLKIKNQIDSENKIPGSSPRMTNGGEGIKVVPIPGASALTSTASISGMIEKEFYFAGFLPRKKGRQSEFKKLLQLDCPIIIYESANRLEKLLGEIKANFGDDTEVFIARESTKMFEEYWTGKIEVIINGLSSHNLKGEVALIIQKLKVKSQNL